MKSTKIDMNKMKKAIEQFGSLDAANLQLKQDKAFLEREKEELTREAVVLRRTKQGLSTELSELKKKIDISKRELEYIKSQIKLYSFQYNLFTAFLAMMLGSPSVKDPLEKLIGLFQTLAVQGWYTTKSAGELRTLFVVTVMGDFLKCYRCTQCGTQFIVNREDNEYSYKKINCPVCHWPFQASADDSFLKALVSGEQIDKVYRTEELVKENALLKPLAPFLEVKCEICGNPIKDWTENNVKAATMGLGWAHNECWNGGAGQLILTCRGLKKIHETLGKPQGENK